MRGLPYTLRSQRRPSGSCSTFVVPGPAGGSWTVERTDARWVFVELRLDCPNTVVLDAEQTWRLCVRMVEPEDATQRADIHGDEEIARTALGILAIIRSG